jgi:hypothetical protein
MAIDFYELIENTRDFNYEMNRFRTRDGFWLSPLSELRPFSSPNLISIMV